MAETPERWPLNQGDYERWLKLSVNHRALISDYVERVVHELRFAIYVAEPHAIENRHEPRREALQSFVALSGASVSRSFWQRSGNVRRKKEACYQIGSRLFNNHGALLVGRTRFELVTNGLKVRAQRPAANFRELATTPNPLSYLASAFMIVRR